MFHVTARTVRRERLFSPGVRSDSLSILAEVVPRSSVRLLAAAIMSNHLHLVVQQSEKPLSALMQPLLRRMALLVHRRHGLDGPVFWGRFGSRVCHDPGYVRNAVAYTHLNPVRAGICDRPEQYRWSSHLLYCDPATAPAALPGRNPLEAVVDPALALPLFATGPDRDPIGLRQDYRAFIEWRMRGSAASVEPASEPGSATVPDPAPPDPYLRWGSSLSPLFHAPAWQAANTTVDRSDLYAPDMATLAQTVLAAEAPGLPLDMLRGRGGGRTIVRLRHLLIRRLARAGYRNVKIARFLDLSESAISYVLAVEPA